MKTLNIPNKTECRLVLRRDTKNYYLQAPGSRELVLMRRGNLRDSLDFEAFWCIQHGQDRTERYAEIIALSKALIRKPKLPVFVAGYD